MQNNNTTVNTKNMQKYSIKYSILQCTNTSILQYSNTSILQILQYSKYFNTSILQILQYSKYFNTSINKTQPLFSNKHRGLFGATPWYSHKLQPITDLFTKLYHSYQIKNLNTTIYIQTLKSYCYKKVTAVNGECLYTHTPSGWCSGVLANIRWKRGLNTSGCGISSRNPRY